MKKRRAVEVTITITFIVCVILIWYFGVKYFAGFEYASPIDQLLLKFLTIVFYLCLLYFTYRFLEWMVRVIKRLGLLRRKPK